MSEKSVHFKRPGGRVWVGHCGRRSKTGLLVSSYRTKVTCAPCLALMERDKAMHEARIQVLKQTLQAKRWLRERRVKL